MRKKNWTVTLVALLGFQAGGAVVSAKDYVVDETDIKITYAVNTTDLIARVKKVETVYLSKRQSVEIPKTLKHKTSQHDHTYRQARVRLYLVDGDKCALAVAEYRGRGICLQRHQKLQYPRNRHIYRTVRFLGRSNLVSVISGIRRTVVDRGRRLLRGGSQGSDLTRQTCKSRAKVILHVRES